MKTEHGSALPCRYICRISGTITTLFRSVKPAGGPHCARQVGVNLHQRRVPRGFSVSCSLLLQSVLGRSPLPIFSFFFLASLQPGKALSPARESGSVEEELVNLTLPEPDKEGLDLGTLLDPVKASLTSLLHFSVPFCNCISQLLNRIRGS